MMQLVFCQNPQVAISNFPVLTTSYNENPFLFAQPFEKGNRRLNRDKREERLGIEKFADNRASLIFATPY